MLSGAGFWNNLVVGVLGNAIYAAASAAVTAMANNKDAGPTGNPAGADWGG